MLSKVNSFFQTVSKLLLLAMLTASLATCTSAPKVALAPAGKVEPIEKPGLGRQISFSGESRLPRFSPNGKWIAYIGKKRSAYHSDQIYLFSLVNGIEKQITFQAGQIKDFRWISDAELVISTNTDSLRSQSLKHMRELTGEEPNVDFRYEYESLNIEKELRARVASSRKLEALFQPFALDAKAQAWQSALKHPSKISDVSISAQQDLIAFISDDGGSNQVYWTKVY